ncbi:MAG: DNA polymerase III subunit alpha, partial [Clostridiales bacterium]
VGRVLDIPYADVDRLVKLMPEDPKIKTIAKAMELSSELRYAYENDPQVKELLDIADKIQGMPSHCGKHAAGVAIAQNELVSYMPVQKDNKDGSITTQYSKEQVEACGLVKMDLLGLRTLSVIDDALENIEKSTRIRVDIEKLPLDDPVTFQMLAEGDAIAVFQLESEGMRKILKSLRPERFEDIVALVALYRPGPLGSGMVDDFIDGKHGVKKVTYVHPSMEAIVKETYGVILYQEQVMQIVQVLGGFSLGKADMIRRAMGKKKIEIINAARDDFVGGCKNNQIDQKTAVEIFELLKKFGEYGFNKSHSAAYALVTYRTAWLKANYPAEFMAAMMTSVMDTVDKVPEYIEECKRMGLTVLPPSINESGDKFNVVDGMIRYALSAVKNVGRDAVKRIVEEREQHGSFTSLANVCERMLMNRKTLESLIRCGALDNLGSNRATMLASVDRALELSKKLNEDRDTDQISLFDFGMSAEANAPVIELEQRPEYPFKELLDMEKEMIGFYVSGHPLDVYGEKLYRKTTHRISQLLMVEDGNRVRTAGMISGLVRRYTKKGDQMAGFILEDQQNNIRCTVFPKAYEKLQYMLTDGRVVMVSARVKTDGSTPELTIDDIQSPLKLFLRMENSMDQQLQQQVRGLLSDYPGMIELRIFYNDLQTYTGLPGISGVQIDRNLLTSLKLILGEGNVVAQ